MPPSDATDVGADRAQLRRVAVASFIGTSIEWYDYFLYGTAAALVFNQLFFPTFEPLAGTLAAFATYSVGFLARPLGGAVFGHLGRVRSGRGRRWRRSCASTCAPWCWRWWRSPSGSAASTSTRPSCCPTRRLRPAFPSP